MLKRIWELHRTMILVGLFGLGIGTWLSADSASFKGVILAKAGESLTVYKSTGEVVVLSSSKALSPGQVVMKRAGESCCDAADSSMDAALRGCATRSTLRAHWIHGRHHRRLRHA